MQKFDRFLQQVRTVGEFILNGDIIVYPVNWLILTASKVSERVILLALIWLTTNFVAHEWISTVLPSGLVSTLESISILSLTLLPEILIYQAVITSLRHWQNGLKRGRWNEDLTWAILYTIPTCCFIWMTVALLYTIATHRTDIVLQADSVTMVVRAIGGWFFCVVTMIHISLKTGRTFTSVEVTAIESQATVTETESTQKEKAKAKSKTKEVDAAIEEVESIIYPKTRNNKDTAPELAYEAQLKRNGVDYVKQFKVGPYRVDFYIPQKNLCVEIFGCYWHKCAQCGVDKDAYGITAEERRRSDAERIEYIESQGYEVNVIWEHELMRKSIEIVQDEIFDGALSKYVQAVSSGFNPSNDDELKSSLNCKHYDKIIIAMTELAVDEKPVTLNAVAVRSGLNCNYYNDIRAVAEHAGIEIQKGNGRPKVNEP